MKMPRSKVLVGNHNRKPAGDSAHRYLLRHRFRPSPSTTAARSDLPLGRRVRTPPRHRTRHLACSPIDCNSVCFVVADDDLSGPRLGRHGGHHLDCPGLYSDRRSDRESSARRSTIQLTPTTSHNEGRAAPVRRIARAARTEMGCPPRRERSCPAAGCTGLLRTLPHLPAPAAHGE
jgi:hypothetical protein